MPTFYLIPIIIFGLIYSRFNHYIKFKLHTKNAQQYIFSILLYGIFNLFLSLYIYGIIQFGITKAHRLSSFNIIFFEIINNVDPTNLFFFENLFVVLVSGIIASFCSAILFNKCIGLFVGKSFKFYSKKFIENEIMFSLKMVYINDHIKSKLIESAIELNTVLIDMSNKKIYLAIVSSISKPEESFNSDTYSICPIKSGYRDDCNNIVFTTDYPALDYGFETTIKGANILSVKDFEFNIFQEHFECSSKSKKPAGAKRKIV